MTENKKINISKGKDTDDLSVMKKHINPWIILIIGIAILLTGKILGGMLGDVFIVGSYLLILGGLIDGVKSLRKKPTSL